MVIATLVLLPYYRIIGAVSKLYIDRDHTFHHMSKTRIADEYRAITKIVVIRWTILNRQFWFIGFGVLLVLLPAGNEFVRMIDNQCFLSYRVATAEANDPPVSQTMLFLC